MRRTDINVWPHEMAIVEILIKAGYKVKFIAASSHTRTADAYVNNSLFEFKSPEGSKIRSIEHILKKAGRQSDFVVLDSVRVKKLRDKNIYNYLIKWVESDRTTVSRIIFINKKREIFDIKRKKR